MPRPKSKQEIINSANQNFDKLWQVIRAMSPNELSQPFDFSSDAKKKEAHWKRDKNLRDVLIHLYEWHQLLIRWIEANTAGNKSPFLPSPYTWKTYGDMNVEIWKNHQQTSLDDAENLLKQSHKHALELVEPFTNDELFVKQYFDWTGSTTLGSYCISALSSHYDWALKKLKAHKKNVSDKAG